MSPGEPLNITYPFHGRWQIRNSPANRVPSHGTAVFGLSYAIDFVPVDDEGRSASFTLGSLIQSEPPESFTGFGRPILSPSTASLWGCMMSKSIITLIVVSPRSVMR